MLSQSSNVHLIYPHNSDLYSQLKSSIVNVIKAACIEGEYLDALLNIHSLSFETHTYITTWDVRRPTYKKDICNQCEVYLRLMRL